MLMALIAINPKGKENGKIEVFNAIEKFDINASSKIVFNFTRSNKQNFNDKKEVIEKFCSKYGKNALDYIYDHAFIRYGLNFTNPDEIKNNKPHLFDEMKALAYGFSYFGFDGFKAISRLLYSTVDMKTDVIPNKYPLAVSLAYIACLYLKNDKKASEKMYSHAKDYILNGNLKNATKVVFISMIEMLGFKEKFINDQSIPQDVKNLILR